MLGELDVIVNNLSIFMIKFYFIKLDYGIMLIY